MHLSGKAERGAKARTRHDHVPRPARLPRRHGDPQGHHHAQGGGPRRRARPKCWPRCPSTTCSRASAAGRWSMRRASRWRPARPAIREFINDHQDIVFDDLVDEADNLYAEQVLLPLVRRAQTSSPPSPTEPSTSAETGLEETPRKPSRRSSTSTTRTNGITTTTSPPAGDSSTSLRSSVGARVRELHRQEDAKVRKLRSVSGGRC